MAFSIAIVVLLMQFLWRFIDEIIGKGVGALVIVELFFYKSVSLFPLALPIAVLLASVMVLGNLAERYELSSFKSAGVSLMRVLLPLLAVCFGVALFSFYCSNTIIPIANLKFQSRLYDIRNHKPTLSIEPGVFNEDFKGFAIRVGKKYKDNETIEDIMVYDDTPRNRGLMSVVTAKRGRMFIDTSDGSFVMQLYDGYQYAEGETQSSRDGRPFMKTHFDEWSKKFDLGQFDLDRTEEDQWKSQSSMKSARQIASEIDTMNAEIRRTLQGQITRYEILGDTVTNAVEIDGTTIDSSRIKNVEPEVIGTVEGRPVLGVGPAKQPERPKAQTEAKPILGQGPPPKQQVNNTTDKKSVKSNSPSTLPSGATDRQDAGARYDQKFHEFVSYLNNYQPGDNSIIMAMPAKMRQEYRAQLTSRISTTQTTVDRHERNLKRLELDRRKHIYQLHWKFSLAVACIVMLMIGGPMGTIVRKGGFGYPLLVSIIFFTFFIMSNISCSKLNDSEKLQPVLAAWIPVILLSVISSYLTYRAMQDAKGINLSFISSFISKWIPRRRLKSA